MRIPNLFVFHSWFISNGGKTGLKSRIILKLLRKFHPTLIISRCCSGCDLKLAAFHPVSELGWLFFFGEKLLHNVRKIRSEFMKVWIINHLRILYSMQWCFWRDPLVIHDPQSFRVLNFISKGEKKSSKIYTRIRKCQKFLCSLLSDLSLRGSGGQIIKRWENGEIFRFSRYSQWKKQNL